MTDLLSINELAAQVQHNCHISDARHGADYAICTFLMKMREYYRWEQGRSPGERLGKDEVGQWLADREALWETLEDEAYRPLEWSGESFDPFDAERLNARLEAADLVYSAGIGRNGKPHFFLARLEGRERFGGCLVRVAGREYARDLSAPPAMTQGEWVFVRREALRQLLWERLEGWRWNRPDNALGCAFACYDFEHDLDGALEAMTAVEVEAVLRHELGEVRAGEILGEDWNALLLALVATPAEFKARAVRDHLADCLSTLPALAGQGDAPPIHFFVGNLSPMRQQLFPALSRAYEEWRKQGDATVLARVAEQGRKHWAEMGRRLVDLWRRGEPDLPKQVMERVEAL